MLTTRDRTDELRALEELWEAPALGEARALPRRLPHVPGALLAGGWLAFFVVAISFQPAPEPGMTWPVWATTVSVVQLVLLLGAAAVGPLFARIGFAAATLAGPLGIALAVNCRASEHHLGNWWLVELAATVALTGLAAVGLMQRLRARG
jgi:uncharacterized membrane protein AbrB (regulator of aidB expression)